jgi:hypothetical protein
MVDDHHSVAQAFSDKRISFDSFTFNIIYKVRVATLSSPKDKIL